MRQAAIPGAVPRPARPGIVARGRVLRRGAQAAPQQRAAWWRVVALVAALPLFAQCFQYLLDVPALYLLCKAWPLLVLPLAAWAMLRLDVPFKPLQVVLFAWLFGVAPFLGIVYLSNGVADAFTTTAKAWSFTFALSGSALLVLLRPRPGTLRRVVAGWGVATYAIAGLLWVLVPDAAYMRPNTQTKLFIWDLDRGFHLYMPMFFGLLLVFTLNRSFWIRRAWWKPALIAGCFAVMFFLVKERMEILSAALVVVVGAVRSLPRRWRPAAFAVLGLAGCLAALLVVQHLEGRAVKDSLGGSLSVRQATVATAVSFLGDDPVRWLAGVGAATRVGAVSLFDILHNDSFYLVDIGWLGVVFEYGLVGATLIALLHLAALRQTAEASRPDDALSLALNDYVLYILVSTLVYSVVLLPGELTTCMALSFYIGWARQRMPDAAVPPRVPGAPSAPQVPPRRFASQRLGPARRPAPG